jgi:Ca-activated chloride channel homolog
MRGRLRRYSLFLLLLLFALTWVFLMSLDFSSRAGGAASDGMTASITWLDAKGKGFPRVEAYLSVLDRSGQPVSGLPQSAFHLEEDDFPAAIQTFLGAGEQTVVTMMVIDRSGSMRGDKMPGARNAASALVDQMRPGLDRAGIIPFDNRVQVTQPLTGDREALQTAISRITPDGGTAFYDAVYKALEELQRENGRRIILALTDGLDNASRRTADEVIRLAQTEGIAIYTIGLGNEGWWIFTELDAEGMKKMAAATGGEYHQTPSASTLTGLYKRIAQVVQNEYVLGYDSPTPQLDGTTRRVRVTIEHGSGHVTALNSYSVSGVLSSSFNVRLFVPLFSGLLILLLFLLFLPVLWAQQQRRMQAAQADYPISTLPDVPFQPPLSAGAQAVGTDVMSGTMICPHCRQILRAGVKFCNQCGKSLASQPPFASPWQSTPPPMAATCRHCRQLLRSGAGFCSHCGRKQ